VAANSLRGPQLSCVPVFPKRFLFRHATPVQWNTRLQTAANVLPDSQSPRVSSFGSPRRLQLASGPYAGFSGSTGGQMGRGNTEPAGEYTFLCGKRE
jgi:hypothetical protein